MAVERDRDSPDWRARVLLAQSLLNQRDPSELTCELAVLALRGATVAELNKYERAAA